MKRRRIHRNRFFWAILPLLAAGCCLYVLSQRLPQDSAATAGDRSAKPVSESLSTGISVYFAPDAPTNTGGVADRLIAFIESARVSVQCAFYELDFERAAGALIAGKNRGIRVGIVSDSDYRENEAIQSCIAAGIPVVFDERNAFMHDKFCVVDGEKVWTGSTNITENCLFKNNNNAISIVSSELAQDYSAEFVEMFEGRRFGANSPCATPYPEVTVGNTSIECYFAPEDKVRDALIEEIRDAGKTIDFLAFSFTSEELAQAMAERLRAGVRVRGIFEKRNAGSRYSRDDWLAQQGAEIRLDRNEYSMHHKVIIVDSETAVAGSYNFSDNAETKNDENVLIVHDAEVAAVYEAEFARLW